MKFKSSGDLDMDIDLNRFVEIEFGKNKLVIARTHAIPGSEERHAVMVSLRVDNGSDDPNEQAQNGGLLLFFPTDEQAQRVHDALLNL